MDRKKLLLNSMKCSAKRSFRSLSEGTRDLRSECSSYQLAAFVIRQAPSIFEKSGCSGFNRELNSVGTTTLGTFRTALRFSVAHFVPISRVEFDSGKAFQSRGRSSRRKGVQESGVRSSGRRTFDRSQHKGSGAPPPLTLAPTLIPPPATPDSCNS